MAATEISLRDDAFVQISFTNNKKFTFFGTEYNNVYIGSNGYLTFGRGDRMYYSHRYYHFILPRISAMFTNLNPAHPSSGKIHYEQTADSFIVTFTHIKTYSGNYFFTFQVGRGPRRHAKPCPESHRAPPVTPNLADCGWI